MLENKEIPHPEVDIEGRLIFFFNVVPKISLTCKVVESKSSFLVLVVKKVGSG